VVEESGVFSESRDLPFTYDRRSWSATWRERLRGRMRAILNTAASAFKENCRRDPYSLVRKRKGWSYSLGEGR
jgi:hypothetical protein